MTAYLFYFPIKFAMFLPVCLPPFRLFSDAFHDFLAEIEKVPYFKNFLICLPSLVANFCNLVIFEIYLFLKLFFFSQICQKSRVYRIICELIESPSPHVSSTCKEHVHQYRVPNGMDMSTGCVFRRVYRKFQTTFVVLGDISLCIFFAIR